MRIVTIESTTAQSADSGAVETTVPAIPFSEFPEGPRIAGPDKDGNLVWTVIVED